MPKITKRINRVARGLEKADLVVEGVMANVITLEKYQTRIAIVDDMIVGVDPRYQGEKTITATGGDVICPGFIDAHIHVESSCMRPSEFAKAALLHGTTTVITDPHEIANVCGESGIEFMMEDSKDQILDFFFMYPSCVPATLDLETSGCVLDSGDMAGSCMWEDERGLGLAEVMNFPGVVKGEVDLIKKIEWCHDMPIDGHCPGLSGKDLNAYILEGIGSDHECFSGQEMLEKLRLGMHVFIREGSVTKNLLDLIGSVPDISDRISFCSDDRLPHELLKFGHMDWTYRISNGFINPIRALRFMTYNTANYFNLEDRGAIIPGRKADLTIMDTRGFVTNVIKNGELVVKDCRAVKETSTFPIPESVLNTVTLRGTPNLDLPLVAPHQKVKIIKVIPDQALAECWEAVPPINLDRTTMTGRPEAYNTANIAKIAVVERHGHNGNVGLGLVHGLGLKWGAIASTVAHDSHNIIVAGMDDQSMQYAIMTLEEMGGGLVVVRGERVLASVPLVIGGLMSDKPGAVVAEEYECLLRATKGISRDQAPENPFMLLSFLPLAVIPWLKITDMGLVDVNAATIVPFVNPDVQTLDSP